MSQTFHERKHERRKAFFAYRYGWKQRACGACAGSGRYDSNGSPPCGACDGTGRETYRGPKAIIVEKILKNGWSMAQIARLLNQ